MSSLITMKNYESKLGKTLGKLNKTLGKLDKIQVV